MTSRHQQALFGGRSGSSKASAASAGGADKAELFEIDLPVPFATHNIDPPSQTATASKEELLHIYRQMVVTRRMETAADALYKQKLIRGFCHLQSGQVPSFPSTVVYPRPIKELIVQK